MVKRDSSLQRPRFHCSRVQWRRPLDPSSRRLALSKLITLYHLAVQQTNLGLAAWPWKPISWSSRRTVPVLKLIPEAVWNSVVSVATDDRRFLRSTCLSTWQSCSVSLSELPLRGWAVVAPRCFHFTITALTVDRGSSSKEEIWRIDFVEWWYRMTVPCWKALSSSVRWFYCQCLSMEIAWLHARFYTSVSNGCGWNSQIQ